MRPVCLCRVGLDNAAIGIRRDKSMEDVKECRLERTLYVAGRDAGIINSNLRLMLLKSSMNDGQQ